LLATDIQYEFTRASMLLIGSASDAELAHVDAALEALVAEASEALSADGIEPAKQSFTRIAECRYQGQGFELRAAIPDGVINSESIKNLAHNFHAAHERDYGHAFTDTPVEVITLRVVGSAPADKIHWPSLENEDGGGSENPKGAYLYTRTTVFDSGQSHDTPRYAREKLLSGQTISGPAVIIQHNSTSLVPPKYVATVSELGNLHITAV
jgi:N-methylhydantoinase A